jgi:hypothetical protein
MNEIQASNAYFIKLGSGGEWEEECIFRENAIKLGFANPFHKECLAGKWEQIYAYWIGQGKTKSKATGITNQIKAFYENGEDTIWTTFYNRKLFWCFANKQVIQQPDGTRIRKVLGKWQSEDIKGKSLSLDSLSGRLTKVKGFRGTICSISETEYLIKRINHQKLPEVQKTENTLHTLIEEIEPLIQHLTWKDFEILVDLIFTHSGWQRISSRGQTEKSIDLGLLSPVTGERAFVQIKSTSTMSEFQDYIKEFERLEEYDKMFYVLHTRDKSLAAWQDTPGIKLWDEKKLAILVVNSGLIIWLIEKVS